MFSMKRRMNARLNFGGLINAMITQRQTERNRRQNLRVIIENMYMNR